jgi:hypothetical protein
MKSTKKSIVKDSSRIHGFILKRIEELKLKPADIIKDAADLGMKIESASLSKYMKHGNCKGGLSEENIIWLCIRYGIEINLMVGTPVIDNNKLTLDLPPYNEEKALAKLKVLF